VSQEQEPRKVLQDGCEQLSRALGAERVAFFRYHPDGPKFTPEAATGTPREQEVSAPLGIGLLAITEELKAGRHASPGRDQDAASSSDSRRWHPPGTRDIAFGVFALRQQSGGATHSEDDLRLASNRGGDAGPQERAIARSLKAQSEQLRKLSWKLIDSGRNIAKWPATCTMSRSDLDRHWNDAGASGKQVGRTHLSCRR
jgi:hypothetical protein